MAQRTESALAGMVLIILGIGLYLLQGSPAATAVTFVAVGGAFFAGYVYRREYGLLVPAGILLGLGLGLAMERGAGSVVGEPVPFGLGLGFLAIYVVDLVYTRSGRWWPLIPGAALVLAGLAEDVRVVRWFFRRGWPLAIAVAGALILIRGLTSGGRD